MNDTVSSAEKQNKISIDNRILDYINQELKKGFSKELIKDALVKVGHHPIHIDFHFNHIQKQRNKKIFFLLIIILIFLISFILLLILYYYNPSKVYNRLLEDGTDLCNKNKFKKAIEKFDKAIALNGKLPTAYGFKGRCYILQEKYNEAILEFNKAIATLDENTQVIAKLNPDFFHTVGIAHCGIGNYIRGISYINRAINLNSNTSIFYYSLAKCYEKIGNSEMFGKYLNKSKILMEIGGKRLGLVIDKSNKAGYFPKIDFISD